jgi:hypothetical protein
MGLELKKGTSTMSNDKSTASTPFATADGQPKTPQPATGARDFTRESRPQPTAPVEEPGSGVESFRPERAQTKGSPAQRVAARDLPRDGGKPIVDSASVNRRGTGSIGNSSKPFRLKG